MAAYAEWAARYVGEVLLCMGLLAAILLWAGVKLDGLGLILLAFLAAAAVGRPAAHPDNVEGEER